MEIAQEIVTGVCLVVSILHYQYLHVNLLIFQYTLVARSTYEPAAYQLEIIYIPVAYNPHDAVQFSYLSKPVFNVHYQ